MHSLKLLVGLALIMSYNQVWAHRFSAVFVMPMSGVQQESGRQGLDGFMFATGEEDAHAFEESDGHLGGLDSYILKIDSASGTTIMLEQLERLLKEEEPIFVTGILTTDTAELLRGILNNRGVVLVDPIDSAMWRSAVASPDKLKSINGEAFSAAFENKCGYAPNLQVIRGYIAARVIAATVRSLDETNLSDPSLVRKTRDRILEHTFP